MNTRLLLVLVLIWMPLGDGFAQQTTNLQITVLDEQEAPISDISVALLNRFSGDKLALQQTNEDGKTVFSDVVITSSEVSPLIPKDIHLSPGYPNPFQQQLNVNAQFEKDSRVVAEIYNTLGQRVLSIPEQRITAGTYRLNLFLGALVDGVYFVRLLQEGQIITQQITKVGGRSGGLVQGSWSPGVTSSRLQPKAIYRATQTDLELRVFDPDSNYTSDSVIVDAGRSVYTLSMQRISKVVSRDIEVSVTDKAKVPLDSIFTALIDRHTADTLAVALTNPAGIALFEQIMYNPDSTLLELHVHAENLGYYNLIRVVNPEISTYEVELDEIPRLTGLIKEAVQDVGHEGWAKSLDGDGSVIDSVYVLDGRFDLVSAFDSARVIVMPMKNSVDYGIGARRVLAHDGNDVDLTIPVISKDKFTITGEKTGDVFSDTDIGKMYWMMEILHGEEGVAGLGCGGPEGIGYYGRLHRFELDRFEFADTTYFVSSGTTGIMKDNVREQAENVFSNYFAPIMGEFAPGIERVSRKELDNTCVEPGYALLSSRPTGSIANVAIAGNDNYITQFMMITTLTNLSDDGAFKALMEEMYPFLYASIDQAQRANSKIPSAYQLTPEDTGLWDGSGNLTVPSKDVVNGYLIYDTNSTPGSMVSDALYVPRRFIDAEW